MSFEYMAAAVKLELPALQKLVLLLLANRTNCDTGRCDPSHKRLARDCGMSIASVKRQILALEEAGILVVEIRRVGDVNLPNQYHLLLGGVGSVGTHPVQEDGGVGSVGTGGWVPTEPRKQEGEPVSKPGRSTPPAAFLSKKKNNPPLPGSPPGRIFQIRESGITTWTLEDQEAAGEIETRFAAGGIEAVVAALRKADKEPLPGRVRRELEAQAGRAAKAEAEVQAEAARAARKADTDAVALADAKAAGGCRTAVFERGKRMATA